LEVAKEGNSKEKVSSWEIEKLGTAFSTGDNPLPLGIAVKISHQNSAKEPHHTRDAASAPQY
jgi:hypothetical protein